ncbi:MAG: hypothetical protein K6L75_00545 [Cellvibrionaceae bacterium]
MKVLFSESAKGKLSQISMAIEINDKQRFSYRKKTSEITSMLKYASLSNNKYIKEKFLELEEELSEQTILSLNSLGIYFRSIEKLPPQKKKLYRGQEIEAGINVTANQENELEEEPNIQKKKKIVYRGKTTYV